MGTTGIVVPAVSAQNCFDVYDVPGTGAHALLRTSYVHTCIYEPLHIVCSLHIHADHFPSSGYETHETFNNQ